MFDILSTAELTVAAAIAAGFLTLAMAETPGGRAAVLIALGAWFAFVLAIGATGALSPAVGARRRSGSPLFCPSRRSFGPISPCLPSEPRWRQRPCRRCRFEASAACRWRRRHRITPRFGVSPDDRRRLLSSRGENPS